VLLGGGTPEIAGACHRDKSLEITQIEIAHCSL
jgi:hypothetical protein